MRSSYKVGLVLMVLLMPLNNSFGEPQTPTGKFFETRVENFLQRLYEAVNFCSYDGMGWINAEEFFVEASWVNASCMERRISTALNELGKTKTEKALAAMTGQFNGCGRYQGNTLNFQPFSHANKGDMRANCVADVYLKIDSAGWKNIDDFRKSKPAPARKVPAAKKTEIKKAAKTRKQKLLFIEKELAKLNEQLKALKENETSRKGVSDRKTKHSVEPATVSTKSQNGTFSEATAAN